MGEATVPKSLARTRGPVMGDAGGERNLADLSCGDLNDWERPDLCNMLGIGGVIAVEAKDVCGESKRCFEGEWEPG